MQVNRYENEANGTVGFEGIEDGFKSGVVWISQKVFDADENAFDNCIMPMISKAIERAKQAKVA